MKKNYNNNNNVALIKTQLWLYKYNHKIIDYEIILLEMWEFEEKSGNKRDKLYLPVTL